MVSRPCINTLRSLGYSEKEAKERINVAVRDGFKHDEEILRYILSLSGKGVEAKMASTTAQNVTVREEQKEDGEKEQMRRTEQRLTEIRREEWKEQRKRNTTTGDRQASQEESEEDEKIRISRQYLDRWI